MQMIFLKFNFNIRTLLKQITATKSAILQNAKLSGIYQYTVSNLFSTSNTSTIGSRKRTIVESDWNN